jgi:sulfatase modifying factor 1
MTVRRARGEIALLVVCSIGPCLARQPLGWAIAPAFSEMTAIAGGCLEIGCARGDRCQRDLAAPLRRVCLDPFAIDRTEVTTADYQSCVRAGQCPAVPAAASDETDRSRHPVIGVDWAGAAAYCRFIGKRLPTEAEWERAALGPAGAGAAFPWGREPPRCEQAVIDVVDAAPSCKVDRPAKPPFTRPVCSRPAGMVGETLCDMIGNAAEWVSDWYKGAGAKEGGAGKNPTGPCAGAARCPGAKGHVIKGGGWNDGEPFARIHSRAPAWKPFVRQEAGIRCAK